MNSDKRNPSWYVPDAPNKYKSGGYRDKNGKRLASTHTTIWVGAMDMNDRQFILDHTSAQERFIALYHKAIENYKAEIEANKDEPEIIIPNSQIPGHDQEK